MIVWAHILGSLLARVVPVQAAYRLVGWVTPLALLCAPGHVRRARENMRQVLGPDASERDVRRRTLAVFMNYGRYMVDLLRLPSLDARKVLDSIEVSGWEHVEEAFSRGGGVVFVTGHIGMWDLAAAGFVTKSGRPVSVLVETLRPPSWNTRVQQIRKRVGMRAIAVETGLRDMVAALRRKEGLAILADRPVGPEGVPITFFGRRAYVPGGAATLALRTGSPVVPVTVLRKGGGNEYEVLVGEPISIQPSGDPSRDIQALTQRFMERLEAVIREKPEQWYMFRRMWRTADGETVVPGRSNVEATTT